MPYKAIKETNNYNITNGLFGLREREGEQSRVE